MTRQIVHEGDFVRISDDPQVYEVVCQVLLKEPKPLGGIPTHNPDVRREAWHKAMGSSRLLGPCYSKEGGQWWLRRVEDAGVNRFVRAWQSALVVVGSVLHDAGVQDRQDVLTPEHPKSPHVHVESWRVESRSDDRVLLRRRGRYYLLPTQGDVLVMGDFISEAKTGPRVYPNKSAALAAMEALNKEKK